jgi:tRNA U34 5-carboxymethylaminomethyl modifying GTPase MnmE/TrmE
VVQYQDGRSHDEFAGTSDSELNRYLSGFVTETNNPENHLGVAEVQVSLPAPLLASGVVLIDTPGIGSTYRHNTMATLNFLQQCDAALFLISADPPITEAELTFLCQVREQVPRLFFVMNKIDYLDDQELNEALIFYKRVLKDTAGWDGDPTVFCVSARNGLHARTAMDASEWVASGMAKLETFLKDFLAKEKMSALIDAVAGRAGDAADAILMDAGIALRALQLPQEVLGEKIVLFEQSMRQASREGRLILDVLEGDKKRILAFIEEESKEMRREAEIFLKEMMSQGPGVHRFDKSHKSGIQQAWTDAIPEYFGQQQATLNEQVREHLLECLTPHGQRLDQLVETLRRSAADLFQVPYSPLVHDEPLEIKRKPYWVLNTWSADPLPILKSIDQRRDDLARRNVENIRWSTIQNINISFARFASRIKERLGQTVAATKGAMDVAQERRQSNSGNIEEELSQISKRISNLESVRKELAGAASRSAQPDTHFKVNP